MKIGVEKMKFVQFVDSSDQHRVGVVRGDEVADLTSTVSAPDSIWSLYYEHGGDQEGLVTVAERLLQSADVPVLELGQLLEFVASKGQRLTKPISGPRRNPHGLRVWLAGVTHEDSAKLREIEAKQATGDAVNVYDLKYRECAQGGRPELFAKGEPESVVGHGDGLTRPEDTQRLVPETELVSLYGLSRSGQVERLGYTGGNDVTDNGIEAANPLNLPQAKNWSGGCASLGPLLVTADEFDDREVTVSCEIIRHGERVGFKEGKTGRNSLNMPEGLFHMERTLLSRVPLEPGMLLALFWGTPIVFSEADLSDGLQVGDELCLRFSGGIGQLRNRIVAPQTIDQLRILSAAS
jgi:hypothetical protein